MIESAVSKLVGRASVRRHHEQLMVRLLEIAFLVGPINHPANRFGSLGPLGAFGFGRHLDEWLGFIRHRHSEGYPAAIWRPFHAAWRLRTMGDLRNLARVHPAHVDLGCAIAGRGI